jgi:hypothetical protein
MGLILVMVVMMAMATMVTMMSVMMMIIITIWVWNKRAIVEKVIITGHIIGDLIVGIITLNGIFSFVKVLEPSICNDKIILEVELC